MVNPVLAHCLFAFLIGAIGPEWYGAVFATAIFYGRELTQYQTKLAKERGVTRSSLWYILWPKGHEKEFIPAAFCGIIGAWLLHWSIG